MSKKFIFVFNDKEFKVPINQNFLNKIGNEVIMHFIEFDKYTIQSKVQLHNFEAFLAFLTSDNNSIEINSDNYYDYSCLSEEFNNILSDILCKPEYDDLRKESIIKCITSDDNRDKSFYEKYIASNLDYYLNNHSEKMSQVPFTSLYNIFNHDNCNLTDHEKAYQFIIQNINQNDNQQSKKSFCVLLGSLEGTKLSEKSIKESNLKREEHFGFVPKSNDSFICSVNQNITELKNQIENKFEEMALNMISNQQKTLESISQIFEEKVKSIEGKYEQLSHQIEEAQNKIQLLQTNNGNVQNDVQQLHTKVDDIQTNCQQLLQQINSTERSNDITNSLQQLHTKVDGIQTNCQQLPQQINDAERNNDITNSLQQLHTKVDDIKDCTQLHYKLEHEQFNGIIRQLTEQCGGNVHDKGIVSIDSSPCDSGRLAKHVVDFDQDHYFCSTNAQNSWLTYNFLNRKVRPTHYSIRTSNVYGKSKYNLMNWVIEGSNDNNNWTQLDNRKSITDLDNYNAVQTFEIQKLLKPNESFQYLRIMQTGANSNGTHFLIFSALEYFGSIV